MRFEVLLQVRLHVHLKLSRRNHDVLVVHAPIAVSRCPPAFFPTLESDFVGGVCCTGFGGAELARLHAPFVFSEARSERLPGLLLPLPSPFLLSLFAFIPPAQDCYMELPPRRNRTRKVQARPGAALAATRLSQLGTHKSGASSANDPKVCARPPMPRGPMLLTHSASYGSPEGQPPRAPTRGGGGQPENAA